MPSLLKSLGISSPQEAAELEQDLGIRFKNFTPLQCETWRQQSVYLHLYAQTRTFTHAARAAGVTIRKARQWQSQNTLGFNQRLEIAVLEYTEEIEVLLLDRARQPDSPPTFLTMLLRAQMPEKYGPARRSSPPRDNHGDNDDDPNPEISHNDDDSLEDIRRDLQDLKQFAGLTEPDPDPLSLEGEGWGEGEEHELSPIDQASVEAGLNPAPDLPPTGEDTSFSNLSPAGGETQRSHTQRSRLHRGHPAKRPTDRPSVEADFKPAHDLSTTEEDSSFSMSPPPRKRHRERAHPTTQHLAPRTHPASTAANAVNSNANPNANTKSPTAPAPPTNPQHSCHSIDSPPVIPMKIARHTPTPSFLRRQESIPGRCRAAGEDRSGHRHFHLLIWPPQGHSDSERSGAE